MEHRHGDGYVHGGAPKYGTVGMITGTGGAPGTLGRVAFGGPSPAVESLAGQAECVKREPAAQRVYAHLDSVACQMIELEKKVATKLSDITRPGGTIKSEEIKGEPMPVFFESMMQRIKIIEDAMYGIHDIIDRVDI